MKKKSFWKTLGKQCFDVVFPTLYCGGCGEKTSQSYAGICHYCLEEMVEARVKHKFCSRCGSFYAPQFMSCPNCFEDQVQRHYSKVQSFCIYDSPAREFVKALKFRRALYLADSMAKLMAGFLDIEEDGRFDFLTAVPLHPQRMKERGYNQSVLLAEALTEFTGLTVEDNLLMKVVNTCAQTSLQGEKRRNNMKNAYAVTVRGFEVLEGKRIILVDDVITTGSTASECARMLKRGGAKEIKVVTFAGSGRNFSGGFNGTLP
ncbi:MAG: ComF family protein [Bacillota bacterium]|nr:ComF family protein [Bacillota bacterium]